MHSRTCIVDVLAWIAHTTLEVKNALLRTIIVPIDQRLPEPLSADGDATRLALELAEIAIDIADRGVPAPVAITMLRRHVRLLRESLRPQVRTLQPVPRGDV